jgi:hypothetical protein
MRHFLSLSCLIVLLVSTNARADTIRDTVPTNRASVVGSAATYGPDCTAGKIPELKIRQAPKHGKVSFEVISTQLSEQAGRCAGKNVMAALVIYRPDKGFRGEDTFKVGFVMRMYTSGATDIRNVVDKYIIEVK